MSNRQGAQSVCHVCLCLSLVSLKAYGDYATYTYLVYFKKKRVIVVIPSVHFKRCIEPTKLEHSFSAGTWALKCLVARDPHFAL